MVAGYFLLLAQKKVTKEKGTLAAAVCRHPCRQTTRAGSGVRSRHIRVPRSDARASCARPRAVHAAVSSTCSPRPRGNPGRAERGSPCRRSLSHICGASAFALGFPLSSGEGRTDQPRAPHAGGAMDRADFDNRPWMACGRNPSARSEPSPTARARIRGCLFLWLLSFGQAKESNRRPWMVDEPHTDVSRLSRSAEKPTKRLKQPEQRAETPPHRST